ncbi:MAG TPA: CpsD/CapB family tyrosine-protein kinase [Bryobacteraceae bacterium]|nr:CpsD/CapB family tyrosine-protein kinase [Bryobacteraceae bacterium]
MSRVHDALRRAEQLGKPQPQAPAPDGVRPVAPPRASVPVEPVMPASQPATAVADLTGGFLDLVQEVPFSPAPEALLIDHARPQEAPSEEFRSLRTRLNHLQTLQPIHTVVFTSPSPAEGKSFAAANLALAESHLASNPVLLIDFDFRRPVVHNLFQLDRSPGATDYLLGHVPLHEAIRRVEGTNLYIMPAGRAVKNPLELLNLREVKALFQELPKTFNWVILDSPPLLFSADANLLGTITDGTILVVRIGSTTIDTVHRSMQTLCENNVLGIVVNGARAGELYSKYTYYYSKYGHEKSDSEDPLDAEAEDLDGR